MDKEKIISYIENSFLSPILKINSVTDISFNGSSLFYVDNDYGRKKSDINISNEEVRDFLRQLANLTEKQFSYQDPFLDVSVGRYRINAVHQSIARKNNENVLTFSLRIASLCNKINNDKYFLNDKLKLFFKKIIDNNCSIVISGITGTGKTEFQKYLISLMKNYTRTIVIDNVQELETLYYENDLDLTYWLVDDKNINASSHKLIKNALRSNPDWLIVAESRGEEVSDVITSAMTGHPIITTIHALDNYSVPTRMARLSLKGTQNENFNNVLEDILYHIHFYVYLKKEVHNQVINRYISSIMYRDNNGVNIELYSKKNEKELYYNFDKKTLKSISFLNENLIEGVFEYEK